jgi:uncharacterized delta-60 repeat protein
MGVAGRRQSNRQVLLALLALGAAIVALAFPGVAWGAAGDLDPSFAGDGIATAATGPPAIALDSKGRIVVAFYYGVERFMPNGTLDKSFSGDGSAPLPFDNSIASAESVTVDSHDRIVVAGGSPNPADPHNGEAFAVGRLTANGSPDPSFSGDGQVLTQFGGSAPDFASAVAVDAHGRIVAAGNSAKRGRGRFFAVARYLPNGAADRSFSGDGQVETDFPNVQDAFGRGVAFDSKGRIVVAGTGDGGFAIARYTPAGGLDPAFSSDGMLTARLGSGAGGYGAGLAVDDSDRIVIAGGVPHGDGSDFALARFRPNGAFDRSFTGDGSVLTSFGRRFNDASGVAIDHSHRIVAVGTTYNNNPPSAFAIARYTPSGHLDSAFSGDGRVTTSIAPLSAARAVAIDPNDNLDVFGTGSDMSHGNQEGAVARYLGG